MVLEPDDIAANEHAVQDINDAEERLVASSEAHRDPSIVRRLEGASLAGFGSGLQVRLHLQSHGAKRASTTDGVRGRASVAPSLQCTWLLPLLRPT